MDEKALLRREVKRLKGLLPDDERLRRSEAIWAQVEAMPRFVRAATLLMYWSMPGEVHTHDFIRRWSRKKTIVLPAVDGDRLRLVAFEGEQSLRRNTAMNLYEPQGDDFRQPQSIELAMVPGIAFDRSHRRMGRGCGYYDRLLPHLCSYNIGVCFDFQMFDVIPYSEHDVPMDEVITG